MHEAGIIQNPTPPSPLLQMSSPDQHLHASHNTRDNHINHNTRQTVASPSAPPLLTSNGYVTHEAIIGKVRSVFRPFFFVQFFFLFWNW